METYSGTCLLSIFDALFPC